MRRHAPQSAHQRGQRHGFAQQRAALGQRHRAHDGDAAGDDDCGHHHLPLRAQLRQRGHAVGLADAQVEVEDQRIREARFFVEQQFQLLQRAGVDDRRAGALQRGAHGGAWAGFIVQQGQQPAVQPGGINAPARRRAQRCRPAQRGRHLHAKACAVPHGAAQRRQRQAQLHRQAAHDGQAQAAAAA